MWSQPQADEAQARAAVDDLASHDIAGGTALILVVSSKGVLPEGAAPAVVDVAETIADLPLWSAFLSAVAGGR